MTFTIPLIADKLIVTRVSVADHRPLAGHHDTDLFSTGSVLCCIHQLDIS